MPLEETRENTRAILSRATGLAPTLFVGPPPVNDDRPNETTWTVFKRIVDDRRAAGEWSTCV